MTLFPELKEDFTAENGVTYTWEENRWRTKSFLTADGSEVEVGPNPPPNPSEGGLWYDSTRLELFVFYTDPDGVGGWVPCSPLGARVEAGEIVQAQLVERVGELEKRDPDEYLKKTGGTMTGQLACERSGTGNTYVFSCKAQGLPEGNQVAFRVTGDGAVKAGHSTSSPFMATAANDVLTKKYADDHTLQPDKSNDVTTSFRVKSGGNTLISASGNNLGLYNLSTPTNSSHAATKGYVDDHVGPTTKYDGNRLCKSGLSSTALNDGEVMFMTNQLVSTSSPNAVQAIGFSLNDFNWSACAKSGVIKVKNGSNDAGFYQVYDLDVTARQAVVKVEPIFTYGTQTLEPDTGTPCYFHGVFFE